MAIGKRILRVGVGAGGGSAAGPEGRSSGEGETTTQSEGAWGMLWLPGGGGRGGSSRSFWGAAGHCRLTLPPGLGGGSRCRRGGVRELGLCGCRAGPAAASGDAAWAEAVPVPRAPPAAGGPLSLGFGSGRAARLGSLGNPPSLGRSTVRLSEHGAFRGLSEVLI